MVQSFEKVLNLEAYARNRFGLPGFELPVEIIEKLETLKTEIRNEQASEEDVEGQVAKLYEQLREIAI